MKKLLVILLLIVSPLKADKIEQLSWYNVQELLEDDKLTYKIIKSCVSLNSAVTELITEEHPDLANEFIKSLNISSTKTIIGHRQIYAASMGEGKTAVEKQKKSKAVEEIKNLSEQILVELK